jgi:hypothetical protein
MTEVAIDIEAATRRDAVILPHWIDPFVCQYQMADTSPCPETILNANRSTRWNQSYTTNGVEPYSRDSDQLHYMAECPPVEHEPILDFAQECLLHYVGERKQAGNNPKFGLVEGYNILRYKPGQAYHGVHADWGWPNLTHRHVTFSMFLNTISDGGELVFPEQGLEVKPVEGRAVILPAGWTHAHRSLPARTDRYIFNIFYGFLPSDDKGPST